VSKRTEYFYKTVNDPPPSRALEKALVDQTKVAIPP